MEHVEALIRLLVIIMLVNLVSSGLLWLKHHAQVYKYIFIYWLAAIIMFALSGITMSKPLIYRLLVNNCGIIASLSLVYVFCTTVQIPVVPKIKQWCLVFFITSLTITAVLVQAGVGMPYAGLPAGTFGSLNFFILGIHTILYIRQTGKQLSVMSWFLWVATILFGFNVLFSNLIVGQPHLETLIFISFAALLYAFSVFGFSSAMEVLQIEKNKANVLVLQAEKESAEKLNQNKSLFLANISHELRTPMHGILSFAKFGKTKIDSPKEKLLVYFEEIYDSGTTLMSLLNDLLDLSKLEAGKIEYLPTTGNLTELAQSVANEMKAFADENGVSIAMENNLQSTDAVFDQEKTRQVVRNLLSNAIKFSTKGTTITIQTTLTDQDLQFKITNLGPGIPKTELESIFDKFVQSSKTRTGAGGTGLGLAICKEIIQHQGGKIWAESSNKGETTFTFELPQSLTQ